ncbi:aspartate aminotransferase family protein [Xanthomonas translucens]|uniref:Adenosylmethionine-8-amino-7-oxononanoate aminotransferase n=3 Tax=Xanthomonas campestris pv. translucens TaxID=343 RepID=A0A109HHK1_XANCT|nr:aminotransferase class III-fold pyridoxal phosphate-dependent enzyme [Xanthomonas translucens]KWV12236.1 adenosylmethionine-8-amino-7-oxononanoate aminotransferase [Xanthomonas translucens]MCC8445537.1 aminotransferase class III-fold pyridoxal phosphate-dependent enzyme [Xanthomonas translucens pv. translucens]MCT8286483.1 aminotransferase class III-fold pyridoxal phosphate-dependent enzyme [Xanthomonas translucens pv. translucens]MCT8304141.1 aminotransferase class III-fold pyridoxal phosph
MNRNVPLPTALAPLHGDLDTLDLAAHDGLQPASPDPDALLRTGPAYHAALGDAQMLADEAEYCSFGDTVHYSEPPRIFAHCDGSYLYDTEEVPYLDLQMWYSAVNFGYANPRLNGALKRQIDSLPQVASQYLHPTKIELAKTIAQDAQRKWGRKGRVHFNVGGAQAVEDSLKLVRNATGGKSLMFAFEGGYHGRTLGASAITSSYRYRRRFGHFDRAQFIEFPYHFRGPKGISKEEYGEQCVAKFERLFETEYNGVWDPKAGQCEYAAFYVEPIQGTGGYVIPPPNFFTGLKRVLDKYGILLVVDEIQMGFFRTGKLWAIEHFGVTPDVLVFGKALTNGLNPLAGVWAREELINPTVFPPGSTHSTFASNPLGTAVGLETMRMLAETDYETMVMEKGAHFLDGLRDLQTRHPEIGDVDGLGLALRAEICQADGFTPNRKLLDTMVDMGLEGELRHNGKRIGLVLDVGGYYKNVITLAPSLHISHDEIDLGLSLLDQLLTRAKRVA